MTVNLACTHCDVITDLSDIHKVIADIPLRAKKVPFERVRDADGEC
jgi:hypothetical protein